MRRPTSGDPAASPGAPRLLLTPRDGSGRLPEWSPPTPPGGWTPRAAAEAAIRYGEEHADALGSSARRLAKFAYRALLNALPEVKRAELLERLEGVDHLGDYFDPRRDSTPEEPAPF